MRACAIKMHVDISRGTQEKCRAPEGAPEARATLCWSQRSQNACQHFTRATSYGNLHADQSLGPHFVRACVVEMHFNISREPLYTEIYRKNAAPHREHQKLGPHFARACAVDMHVNILQEPLDGNLQIIKCRRP